MKQKTLRILFLLLTFVAVSLNAQQQAPLMTPWASEAINATIPLDDYPRPSMVRTDWMCLNGTWQFEESTLGAALPTNKKLKEKILVPYPWESALSGIKRQLKSQRAVYRRTFNVPQSWKGSDVLLHFGAVDFHAVVYINGKYVGEHKGGLDAFNFNVTPYLKSKGEQEIIVQVYDPTNTTGIAVGKQNITRFDNPHGYTYSPSSGIWQTVWLEPVSKSYISSLRITPDIDKERLTVEINNAGLQDVKVEVEVIDNGNTVANAAGKAKEKIILSVENPKLWSPDSPFLYDINIVLRNKDGKVLDQVSSYAGMRKISLKNEKGVQRLALNNEFIFQMGPLDQGYWPDGIYTAPTDEALRWEVENMKAWGFNMVRKHIKVEPERWYYWCDKLGLLVWQDMPSTYKVRSEEEENQFETELIRMVKTHWNHPSIVNWIVFNEHWGLYDCERLTEYVMQLDPSRLVTGNSGIDARKPSIDYEVGHIKDNHSYRPPHVPLISSKRATVNGEYGAIGYLIDGHIWDKDGPWVHYQYDGKEAATTEYERFITLINGFITRGLSAAVYTQWTDVENEMNGLYTYDRKVEKLDKERIIKANRSTYVKKEMTKGQTDIQHIQ